MAENWRDMEAGPKLDRLIAEKAGLNVYKGLAYGIHREWLESYYIDEKNNAHEIPHYSTSVDAALGLPIDDDVKWDIWKSNEIVDVNLQAGPDDNCHGIWYGDADTLALAICRAWLAYMESTEAA